MKLEKGEVVCSNCNGTGNHQDNNKFTCQTCYGSGKLDWLENVVGKKIKIYSPYITFSYNFGVINKNNLIIDSTTT